jgi:hypothetical protein
VWWIWWAAALPTCALTMSRLDAASLCDVYAVTVKATVLGPIRGRGHRRHLALPIIIVILSWWRWSTLDQGMSLWQPLPTLAMCVARLLPHLLVHRWRPPPQGRYLTMCCQAHPYHRHHFRPTHPRGALIDDQGSIHRSFPALLPLMKLMLD